MESPVIKAFVDVWVFYEDRPNGHWIGHSLNTDQAAVGDCLLDAYVELHKAMDVLLAEARKDPRLNIFQSAPKEICDLAERSRKLPEEIREIAEMRLRGEVRRLPLKRQNRGPFIEPAKLDLVCP